DGVRAVAISLVLLHHLTGGMPHRLEGGFLGVDVFFVLSGYLITGILLTSRRRSGRLALLSFWLRRARRLLPPLVLTLVLVSLVVWWAAPPELWPGRRDDALWALLYGANWHAVGGVDVWGRRSGDDLLGHTWSLAVEEQFYLVWPLLLAASLALGPRLAARLRPQARLGRRLRAMPVVVCLGAAGASFAWLAHAYRPLSPEWAYYDTRGRIGELLAGATLALAMPAVRRVLSRRGAGLLAVVGISVLVAAVCVLDYRLPAYYRGGAVAVTVATACLLVGVELAPAGAVGRALSTTPLVSLGRISYTVYLVHYPVVGLAPLPNDGWCPPSPRSGSESCSRLLWPPSRTWRSNALCWPAPSHGSGPLDGGTH
ncbi:MAG: acyltransferase family protein, partial [Kineosporiaceae bacterium]